MQIKLNNILAALTVAGIAAAALPANAATTYAAGDLLLSFRATGGTGASSTIVVNLGQADTVYRDATGALSSIANIGTQLTNTFGAGWATRSDLFWGVVGVRDSGAGTESIDGDPRRTIYASAAQTTIAPGVQSSEAWTLGTTSRSGTSGQIAAYEAMFTGTSAPTFLGGLGAIIPTSDVNTWEDFNDGSVSFANFAGGVEGNFANGASGTALDLYRILNTTTGASPSGTVGTGSWEGTFTISSGGVVSFTPGAVPEPSRIMLSALGLTGLLMRRRRSAKA